MTMYTREGEREQERDEDEETTSDQHRSDKNKCTPSPTRLGLLNLAMKPKQVSV